MEKILVLNRKNGYRIVERRFYKDCRLQLPVFIRASILERSLLFCIMGVSLRSTSLKFPLEPLGAERPANSDVVSAFAMSMASLASVGKNNLANATAVYVAID